MMEHKKYLTTFTNPENYICDGYEFDDFEDARRKAIDLLIECMDNMYGAIGFPRTWTDSQKEEWNHMIDNNWAYVCEWDDEEGYYDDCWDPDEEYTEAIGWKMYE